MIYQTPENPHTALWDKNGLEWQPNGDSYEHTFGTTRRTLTWTELVAKHGPLSDTTLIQVGETTTITEIDVFASDVPNGTIFTDNTGTVFARIGNTFQQTGTQKRHNSLPAGTYTRLA